MNKELKEYADHVEQRIIYLEDLILRLARERTSKHNNMRIADSIRKKVCNFYNKSKKHTYMTTAAKFSIGTTTVYRILTEARQQQQEEKEPVKTKPQKIIDKTTGEVIQEEEKKPSIIWIEGFALPWKAWANDSIRKIADATSERYDNYTNKYQAAYGEIYGIIERNSGKSLKKKVKQLPAINGKKPSKLDAVFALGLAEYMTSIIKSMALHYQVPICRLENDFEKSA